MKNNFAFLDKLSIKNRIILLVLSLSLVLLVITTIRFAFKIDNALTVEKETQLKSITQVCSTIIDDYKNDVDTGKLTLDDAKVRAMKRIKSLRYGKGAYVYITDMDGTMLMHPVKPELVGSSANSIKDPKTGENFLYKLSTEVKQNGQGVVTYNWTKPDAEGKFFKKMTFGLKVDGWDWIVSTGIFVDDITAETNAVILEVILLNVILSIIVCFGGYLTIGKSIIEPIEKLTALSEELATNNLTIEIEDDENQTEIGELNRSFKLFVSNFRDLIKQTHDIVLDISSGAQQMNASAEQTAIGSQQISLSIVQLAEGSRSQSDDVNSVLTNVHSIDRKVQRISTSSNESVALSEKTKNDAAIGLKHVETAVSKINLLKNTTFEISNNINELGSLSSEIEVIVELIRSISSQTNLLALNAAIEAARAGEHGKGFAVVADEVKKLAGQSAEATGKIAEMILEIQNKTKAAVTAMNADVAEVEESVVIIDNVSKSLKGIIEEADNTYNQVSDICSEVSRLANNATEVTEAVKNISEITEAATDNASSISAVTEEQSASLQEISASSATLSQIAEKLQIQVQRFKI